MDTEEGNFDIDDMEDKGKGGNGKGKKKGKLRKAAKESFPEGAFAAHPGVDSVFKKWKAAHKYHGNNRRKRRKPHVLSYAVIYDASFYLAAREESRRKYGTEAYYHSS